MQPVKRVRLERKSRQLSQIQIEAATGVRQSVLSPIETGRLVPTNEQLARLAAFFGVPADELLKDVVVLESAR